MTRALFGDGEAESTEQETESFDIERFLRTLAGQDTEQSRERRTGKQVVAVSLVVLGVLRRLAKDERIGQFRSRANASEAEPEPADESSGRSVAGTLLRLLVFAAAVAVVAYVVKTRRGDGDELADDVTERDITETDVAEENVMGTEGTDESDVDEMVDAVEDDEGDHPPEPGETIVEEDVVDAATGETDDGTSGEAALNAESESDDEATETADSDATEGESPLESDDDTEEATGESPNQ